MSHTPGPWVAFYKSKYDEWHVCVPLESSRMRWPLFDDGVRSQNPEADAKLIAAAPELLAALLLIDPSGKFEQWQNAAGEFIGDKLASSVAKATGTQS